MLSFPTLPVTFSNFLMNSCVLLGDIWTCLVISLKQNTLSIEFRISPLMTEKTFIPNKMGYHT